MRTSFFEKKIAKLSAKFALGIFLVYSIMSLTIGLVGLPVYYRNQKASSAEAISSLLGKDYYFGNFVAIKSTLDLWTAKNQVEGLFVDASGEELWRSSGYRWDTSDIQIEKDISYNDQKIGTLKLHFDNQKNLWNFLEISFLILAVSLILLGIMLAVQRRFIASAMKPLFDLRDGVQADAKKMGFQLSEESSNDLVDLQRWFSELSTAWKMQTEKMERVARLESLFKIASQVSHDIRSPLSALNMVTDVSKDMPADRREMIRAAVNRINDIANDLLTKARRESEQELKTNEPILLISLLGSIASEKRVLFQERKDVEIIENFKSGQHLFARIKPVDLAVVVSNLVNNSVESSKGRVRVVLSLEERNGKAHISVSDDGVGMSAKVLSQVGNRGYTFRKKGGTGLGIAHAKATIESWGGKLLFESVEGSGTKATIVLPTAPPAEWYLDKITLEEDQDVISIDDDQCTHDVWRTRLCDETTSKHETYLSLKEAADRSQKSGGKTQELFLVDFEFRGEEKNGLDFIEEMGIQKNAVLVTSRFDDKRVQQRAQQLGVKIIPKLVMDSIPIIQTQSEIES